jgi:N-glycosylase/DNA lyase
MEECIRIPQDEPFAIEKILNSGQVFRFLQVDEGSYRVFSGRRSCIVRENRQILCKNAGDRDWFYQFFDLGTAYGPLMEEIRAMEPGILSPMLEAGRGIRILRQDRYETLIAFILSANNNIKRFSQTLWRLCKDYGRGGFPSPKRMAGMTEEEYRELGCGYRAPWFKAAAQRINAGYSLDALDRLPTPELVEELQSFNGVGPKVADCIALFAYARQDVFPVDTWIGKAYRLFFDKEVKNPKTMRQDLLSKFTPLAGLAQQFIFYYLRSKA